MHMHQDSLSPSAENLSSVSQPGLILPTPSMQNQIHELAKTLPPPRKQNTACDACRARKVKCNRLPGSDKHCLSKNYPCTHYVQQATSEKKRSSVTRRPRGLPSTHLRYVTPVPDHYHKSKSPSGVSTPPLASPTQENGAIAPIPTQVQSLPLLVRYGFYPPLTLNSPTREVLSYLFSPPEDSIPYSRVKSPYALWGELGYKLEDDEFKAEFALDLVEVFFQIVHTRIPLLNPAQFRNRLQLHPPKILSNEKPLPPLHPALVATVLAWGTKFSEHALLVADRRRPNKQSLLAKTMIDRARDLAEALKVHRIASPDHVVIGLLIEPLQSQNPEDSNGFHSFWLTSATRHLLHMQINHKSVMANIEDPEARGTMIFAWWMACICDAYASAYYRRKPVLDDEDYDIDFYTADPVSPDVAESHTPIPSPREQLEGYYRAAHSLARTTRHMSRQLWRPTTESEGLPYEVLCSFITALTDWRDEFLTLVGVPSNFEGEWDFVSAVSSCASDATYHVMWIILFNALDEFGVKEINDVTRMGNPASPIPTVAQIDTAKRKVVDEALHGALRIAGLAGVLTSNGYLRLDPAVMHVSCFQAGTLLARLGRPEVSNCIEGLEQYSYSYEEAGDQAIEMKRTYTQIRAGETDLNHMASVVPRMAPASHAMLVDSPMLG
ncbi:hypothetical protein BD779DRAFT_1499404 [Infundibulicybe gibba]|nr:hypothetical protein BD779DRAFT_1499404 [Infundibulicybe gibba]